MKVHHSPNSEYTQNLALSVVKWVDTSIVITSSVIAIGALVVMFTSLMAEVFVRYFTNQGMGWPTEIPNIFFPWLVCAGIVLAAQKGQHIAVTAINGFLGSTGNRILLLAQQCLVFVTFISLAWVGISVIEITGSEVYPVTGITARWAYLALIVGFVGLAITAITTFAHLLCAQDPLTVRVKVMKEDV